MKTLDFGLARIFEREATPASLSQSPTLVSGATGGMILGTAAYMSPEQARGHPADRRCDVWAFGCVLYEMLTGKPAFAGDTVMDILGAVMKLEPDWKALPENTPSNIRRLLVRCLQKDRRSRLRDVGDAQIEIDEKAAEPESAVEPAHRSKRFHAAWVVAIVAILVACALATALLLRNSPDVPQELRLDVATPPTTDPLGFAISPDGRKLVFVATSDSQPKLWLRPLDSTTALPIAGTEGASNPFWSPTAGPSDFSRKTISRVSTGAAGRSKNWRDN